MLNLARFLLDSVAASAAFAVVDMAFLEGLVGHCDNGALFRTAAGPIF